MNFELLSYIENPILVALKIAAVVFTLLYIVFAAILIKQVKIMTDTLRVGLENWVKVLVFVHFVFALGVFLLALIIL